MAGDSRIDRGRIVMRPYSVIYESVCREIATGTVAVPDKIIGLMLILDFIDRGHSLCSLYLPQAAVASLPRNDNINRKKYKNVM